MPALTESSPETPFSSGGSEVRSTGVPPLGALAVASDEVMSRISSKPLDQTPWTEVSAEMEHFRAARATREQEVREARGRLSGLAPNQAKMFDAYMQSASPLLRTKLGIPEGMISWNTWLAEEAADSQVLDVLKWHTDKLHSQQQSPEFGAEVEHHKNKYALAVEAAVAKGWIHPEGRQAAVEVQGMSVYVGDYFNTVFKGMNAYHVPGTNEIVLGQEKSVSAAGQIDSVDFNHETNHAELGGFDARWEREATTNYIAKRLDSGERSMWPKSEAVFPEEGYSPEERLMHLVHKGGLYNVPIELRTRAYSARSPEARAEAIQKLDDALDAVWGVKNFRHIINKAVENKEQYYIEKEFSPIGAEIRAVNGVYDELLDRAEQLQTNRRLLVARLGDKN
ncbi:MAG TPA: hypothetical protein VK674_05040 [Candidatus Limnocylindria bacterium]|nr:hypothetical protein [Candidatus Limnocylindria bacterium]